MTYLCLVIACVAFVLAGFHLAQGNAVWAVCLLLVAVSNVVSALIYEQRRYREESAKESVVVISLKGLKDEQVQND